MSGENVPQFNLSELHESFWRQFSGTRCPMCNSQIEVFVNGRNDQVKLKFTAKKSMKVGYSKRLNGQDVGETETAQEILNDGDVSK